MATVNKGDVTLSPDQLNDMDEWILDYFGEHQRATPNLLRHVYGDENDDVSRQWISNRIRRLAEHSHIRRVHPEDATYEFVSDPRD